MNKAKLTHLRDVAMNNVAAFLGDTYDFERTVYFEVNSNGRRATVGFATKDGQEWSLTLELVKPVDRFVKGDRVVVIDPKTNVERIGRVTWAGTTTGRGKDDADGLDIQFDEESLGYNLAEGLWENCGCGTRYAIRRIR